MSIIDEMEYIEELNYLQKRKQKKDIKKENKQLKKNINNAIWAINGMLADYPFTDSDTDMNLWGFFVELRNILENKKDEPIYAEIISENGRYKIIEINKGL